MARWNTGTLIPLGAALACLVWSAALAEPGVVGKLVLSSLSPQVGSAALFLPGHSLMAIPDPKDRTIQIVDTRTAAIVETVSLPATPGEMALSPDGKTLAIILVSTNRVLFLETARFAIRAVSTIPAVVYRVNSSLVFSGDGRRLFVSAPDLNSVVVIDPANANLDRILEAGRGPAQMSLQPQGNFLIVVNTGLEILGNDTITMINAASLRVQFTILTGADFDDSTEILFHSDGQTAFITSPAAGKLVVLDIARFSARTLPVALKAFRILVNAAGTRLWIADASSDGISLWDISDPAGVTLLKSFTFSRLDLGASNNPVFGSDESSIMVAASESREVIEIEALTGKILNRVSLSFQPGGILVEPGTSMRLVFSIEDPSLHYLSLNSRSFVVPILRKDSKEFTGLALANLSGGPASVALTAYSNEGVLVSTSRSVNPSFIILEEGKQKALLVRQLFNLVDAAQTSGWIRAVVPGEGISVFFLQGDLAQTRLDGSVPQADLATRVYLTRRHMVSRGGESISPILHIINPGDSAASVTIRSLDSSGAERARANRRLAARGKLEEAADSLFGNTSSSDGYLVLDADVSISAYQEFTTSSAVFGCLHQVPSSVETPLYAVQMASGGLFEAGAAYFSELNLINTGTTPASIQVLAVGDDGRPISRRVMHNPVSLSLGPGEQKLNPIDELFGLPDDSTDPALTTGSLIVSGQTGNLIGDLVFGEATAGRFVSSLELARSVSNRGLFAQLAEGPSGDPATDFFTGAGFLNPGDSDTSVDLEAFNADGVLLGQATIVLAPRHRTARTMAEWIPAVGNQNGGFVRYTASPGGVVAFGVFGDDVLNFIAAIPPFVF